MLSEQEYEQKKQSLVRNFDGLPLQALGICKMVLIKRPMSDFTNYHTGVTMLKHLLYIFVKIYYNCKNTTIF